MVKITPAGTNPEECGTCGEWIGSSDKLVDSVRRHSACFNALLVIQEIASSENPDIEAILALTIKTVGNRRE